MKASRAVARQAQAVEELTEQINRIEAKVDKLLSLLDNAKQAKPVPVEAKPTAGKK